MTTCVYYYTDTFFKSFDMTVDHLLYYNKQDPKVLEDAELAIDKVKRVIEQHPFAHPVNQNIAEYGLTYREANVARGKNGFRVLYTLTETEAGFDVYFELFLLQKMSVHKALTQLILM
ncbi:MAG: hypothetical protein MJK04_38010 [Psychrosphaera sp.]|nr:hypothetical protein [Psychrosphaera sp.]